MPILIIGGGVSGLTTAHTLLDARHDVTIWAKAWPPDIVSSVAAAIWYPYAVEHDEATEWASVSARRFYTLMDDPATGIRARRGVEYHREPAPRPPWADALPFFETIPPNELPPGYATGFRFEVPVIETPRYLRWLRQRVEQRGARFHTRSVASLDEVAGEWPVIVNCTGLGAHDLVGDESLYPIRGQVVRVAPFGLDGFVLDESDAEAPIYLIPRADGTIVGGTALRGDWDTAVRPATTAAILNAARRLAPALAEAPIQEVRVGLRPGRPIVRLEAEARGAATVIHNYGHGGAGFTLSWGCAEAVARLIEAHQREGDG